MNKMERGIANGLMGQIREEALFAVAPLKYTNSSSRGFESKVLGLSSGMVAHEEDFFAHLTLNGVQI